MYRYAEILDIVTKTAFEDSVILYIDTCPMFFYIWIVLWLLDLELRILLVEPDYYTRYPHARVPARFSPNV